MPTRLRKLSWILITRSEPLVHWLRTVAWSLTNRGPWWQRPIITRTSLRYRVGLWLLDWTHWWYRAATGRPRRSDV